MNLFKADLEGLENQYFIDQLDSYQWHELDKYHESVPPYTGDFKEQTYHLAKQDAGKHPMADAILFFTSKFERFKWDGLDAIGLSSKDRLEYHETIQDVKNTGKTVLYTGVAIGVLFYLFRGK